MRATNNKQPTVAITIRLAAGLHEQLTQAAAEQNWTVNAEINHRLRAGPVLDQLRALTDEISQLRAQVRQLELSRGG